MTTAMPNVHSLAEAHLWAALLPCRACSARGLAILDESVEDGDGVRQLRLNASCTHCTAETTLTLSAAACPAEALAPESARRIPFVVNATAHASELIDAGEWLVLYRMAVESAEGCDDRRLARAMRIEAGQCLAEALRFYPPDSDVPPAPAFYSAESAQRFRDHPALFARQRLVSLLAELPTPRTRPPAALLPNRPARTIWWLP